MMARAQSRYEDEDEKLLFNIDNNVDLKNLGQRILAQSHARSLP